MKSTIALLATMLCLTACQTVATKPTPAVKFVLPSVVQYDQPFLDKLRAEQDPEKRPATMKALKDYHNMRDETRYAKDKLESK